MAPRMDVVGAGGGGGRVGWEGGGSEWVVVGNHSTDVSMGWARNEGVRLNAEV